MNKEEIEKALNNLWCSVTDVMFNVLYSQEEMREDLKIVLNEFKKLYNRNIKLEQENNNLKNALNNELDRDQKTCFYEDGHTGKCLGYSNVDDDEPCEYCKSCEALNVQGDDLYVK